MAKRLIEQRRVCLFYDELEMDSDNLNAMREGLAVAKIQYIDIHSDGTSGRPELSQMEEMVTESVWTVLVLTSDMLQLKNLYLLAVIAEISKGKGRRNIIIVADEKLLSFVPAWLIPLSVLQSTGDKEDWVSGAINFTKRPPKFIDDPDICPIPEDLDPRRGSVLCPAHFSDPNPLSSDEEDSQRYTKACLARKKYLRKRQAVNSLPRNPTVQWKIFTRASDLISILEDWTWNMAKMTGILDEDAMRDRYTITVNMTEVSTAVQNAEFLQLAEEKNPEENVLLYSSVFKNMTDTTQSYHFRTSKETTSSVLVNVDSGITLPGLILKLPTMFYNEDTLCITSKQMEYEKSHQWEADTDVQARAMHKTVCNHYVDKSSSSWKFEMQTDLTGVVEALIKDHIGTTILNLKPKLAKTIERMDITESCDIHIKNDVVSSKTTGKVQLIQYTKHTLNIDEYPVEQGEISNERQSV